MSTAAEHSLAFAPAVPIGRSPRLLLVAYNFPPVGGAGVQRPVKWVKNLRQFGWDVTVLTTENPSVPARDESLLADIPDDVLVIRARTWEPDYQTKQGLVASSNSQSLSIVSRIGSALKGVVKQAVKFSLQPDPQVLWVPNAVQAGRRILRELSHDAILVTAPAYSSFFIGTSLKRQFGLPLVLDFRDEWDLSGRYLENAQRDPFSQFVQDRMQRYVLKRADAVVATTKASTANLAEKLARLKKNETRATTIYNGFDADEFGSKHNLGSDLTIDERVPTNQQHRPALAKSTQPLLCHSPVGEGAIGVSHLPSQTTFRLLYTGTLWNLTTIEPLISAILRLNDKQPELVSKLELVCVGRKTAEQTAILERVRSTGCRLELVDYCDHAKVLDWLRSTNAVCLLLSDVAGAERVVPAKLFEYLANRKEMLAIVPSGETADIVRSFYPEGPIEPKNVDGIVDWLRYRLAGEGIATTDCLATADIHEYSRTTQTRRLAELLTELIQERYSQRRDAR